MQRRKKKERTLIWNVWHLGGLHLDGLQTNLLFKCCELCFKIILFENFQVFFVGLDRKKGEKERGKVEKRDKGTKGKKARKQGSKGLHEGKES